jgi:hypothetical protein
MPFVLLKFMGELLKFMGELLKFMGELLKFIGEFSKFIGELLKFRLCWAKALADIKQKAININLFIYNSFSIPVISIKSFNLSI